MLGPAMVLKVEVGPASKRCESGQVHLKSNTFGDSLAKSAQS
jgi:hypothetical protein